MKTIAAAFLATCLSPGFASAMVIFTDNFDSYADTAAMGAVWTLGDGTLDTGFGNPSQSLAHPGTSPSGSGGNTNSVAFSSLAPATGEILIFSASIFDDGTSANKRVSAGIRNSSPAANIIEMGMYNGPPHYAYRTVLFASGATNWVAFSNIVDDNGTPISNTPVVGWHTYQAEITDSGVSFSLDLNSDGFINATALTSAVAGATGFNQLRLGGPSDLSSGGGGANFDNVHLELIPEPSTAALALAGIACLFLRRRPRQA